MSSNTVPYRDTISFEHLSRTRLPLLRLFCFPYAGGSAEVYRSWQSWFPKQVDVCLAHLPGRGRSMGQKAFTRLTPVVQALADYMGRETEAPCVLYGHSMGALIAFELSCELLRRNGAGAGASHRVWPACSSIRQK